VIDGQLRRHLVANISDLNAMVAAHQARDQNGFDRAYAAALNQRYWIDAVVLSIDISRPATAAAYIDSVRSMKQTMNACVSCLFLGSTSQVDCPSVGTSNCQNDVTAATSMIAALEAGLVRTGPPDSLSAQATQLQEDMAQADTALLAMAKAELTNDQTGFNSARLSLQQAWPAIDADIAAILTS
jgi:type IV secretory pathway TrbL component